MSHYTEGVLQAYLDNEVPGDARAAVDAHVAGCAACAARLHELGELAQMFRSALSIADVTPIPAAALAELRVRAHTPAWSRFSSTRALARAASIVVGLSAVAVAAVPGSPLNDWLRQVWQSVAAKEAAPASAPAPVVSESAEPSANAMYFAPVDGKVRVALQSLANGATVEVHLIDSDRAMVESTNARLRTSPGRAEIVGGTGVVKIYIPRTARDATVEVDGKLFVTRVGDEFKLVSPKAEKLVGPELRFRPER
jgi:hypothetical protein